MTERLLCVRCNGNGVLLIENGVKDCERCNRTCYEPYDTDDRLVWLLKDMRLVYRVNLKVSPAIIGHWVAQLEKLITVQHNSLIPVRVNESAIEAILFRRAIEKQLEGYTRDTAKEIFAFIQNNS